MKHHILACVLAASALAGGCIGYENKTVMPTTVTGSGVDALVGTWASVSSGIVPAASSCTDFKWTPSQQTATSASGAFSASCAGDLKVAGTAAGTLSGTGVTWSANAVASTPLIPSCAVSLTGTAELTTTSIRVPYSGTTCLGPVSGVEVLNKR